MLYPLSFEGSHVFIRKVGLYRSSEQFWMDDLPHTTNS